VNSIINQGGHRQERYKKDAGLRYQFDIGYWLKNNQISNSLDKYLTDSIKFKARLIICIGAVQAVPCLAALSYSIMAPNLFYLSIS
jgi:hypothetical protein